MPIYDRGYKGRPARAPTTLGRQNLPSKKPDRASAVSPCNLLLWRGLSITHLRPDVDAGVEPMEEASQWIIAQDTRHYDYCCCCCCRL